MAKILYLFALIATVQVASALNCYSCDGQSCQQDESRWQKVSSCGKSVNEDKHVGACLLQVYTDNISNKDVTIRKCVIADKEGNKPVYKCNDTQGPTKVCSVCTDDFCNRSSASTVKFSFVTFLGVLVAYLVPKYM